MRMHAAVVAAAVVAAAAAGAHYRPHGGGGGGYRGGGFNHRPAGGGNYVRPGVGCGGRCGGNNYYNGWDRPRYGVGVATGVAIGSLAYSLPGNCVVNAYGGIQYRNCNNTWYRPQYQGSNVAYMRVGRPY